MKSLSKHILKFQSFGKSLPVGFEIIGSKSLLFITLKTVRRFGWIFKRINSKLVDIKLNGNLPLITKNFDRLAKMKKF